MNKIRILIVDDQELFATGMQIILNKYGKDEIKVIGIAPNGKEAVQMTKRLLPDMILMDVRMPVMDGVVATKIIHEEYPDIKILILTTFDDDQYIFEALRNGAQGYILKNIPPEELLISIKTVFSGNLIVSSSVGTKLVREAYKGTHLQEKQSIEYLGEVNFLLSHFQKLSNREAEVLHFLLQDFDNQEISDKLYIAEQTAKNYISVIYRKLDVSDRIHAKKLVKNILAKTKSD
jgi:two-component system, NarL family, response regulator DegU